MSANTDYYWRKIQETESNPVAAYTSKYQTAIDDVLNKIQNRKDFSYDFNADPMYQMYKDQYTKLGNEAAANAAANVSALTGGYGNSYATTAAAQSNQQWLTKLNDMIPELYNMALNKYKLEGDELNNKYSVLGNAEDRDYGKYRDSVSDWQSMLAYLQGAYSTQLANDQWEKEFALKNRPVGGGGGGVVYVSNGKNGKTTSDNSALKAALAKNALNDEIYEDMNGTNVKLYQSPEQHLQNAILQNNIYKATAQAVNNGEIPNTKAAQQEYIKDLTQVARNVRNWN